MRLIQENALVVLGPTASGKTRLGVQLARILEGEVVSADSRQVYRGLNIGAGKDLHEYAVDGVPVPYYLIDIVGLDTEFSVFDYQQRFYEVFEALTARGATPMIVGGTGLYLEAVLKGYRMVAVPENPGLRAELADVPDEALAARLKGVKDGLHNTTDLVDRPRLIRAIEIAEYSRDHAPAAAPEVRPLILGVRWDRAELRARIRARLLERFQAGMVDEVRALHTQGVPWERLERLGLEYRFIAEYIEGKIRTKNNLVQQLYNAICQFAKRQETWFRRMERNGAAVHWVARANLDHAREIVERHTRP